MEIWDSRFGVCEAERFSVLYLDVTAGGADALRTEAAEYPNHSPTRRTAHSFKARRRSSLYRLLL